MSCHQLQLRKMYESFILHTVCHYLQRVGKISKDKIINNLERFPTVVYVALLQLEEIAFDGLIKDKIVFTTEELPVLCEDDPTYYGLLQSTECYSAEKVGPTQSFNFLHLGIQEYFAAKYVTTLSEDKVGTLLNESFIHTNSKSVRLSNMWILYCGLTSGQCKTLRHYLTTYGNRYQQGSNSDQRISNIVTISQNILEDQVKVLYLFRCFQEAQDNVLCKVLSKSFDSGVIDINNRLLPHQVASLGFFLSRSQRKWRKLNLSYCGIEDHGVSILHQYICGNKVNKQEITEINLDRNNLTGASSHHIGDIISHFQPHTLQLGSNNVTNVRDISAAVTTTSTVKVLNMRGNGLTAQEAIAISDMMICLEVLNITGNKLGDHGAELLSEGITNTKILRILDISYNNIGPSGTTSIANALTNNTSLEVLGMRDNIIGQDGAIAIANAITNNKTLKMLSLKEVTMDKESAMIIMRSIHYNNTITKLILPIWHCDDDSVQGEVMEINNGRNKCNAQYFVLISINHHVHNDRDVPIQ